MNILSYKENSIFTGQEIINFCNEHITNKGSHYNEARNIAMHYNFKPERLYQLKRLSFGPGADPCRIFKNTSITFIRLREE